MFASLDRPYATQGLYGLFEKSMSSNGNAEQLRWADEETAMMREGDSGVAAAERAGLRR